MSCGLSVGVCRTSGYLQRKYVTAERRVPVVSEPATRVAKVGMISSLLIPVYS